MKKRGRILKRRSKGIALVIVLGMVFLYAVLGSMLVTAGKVAAISERVIAERANVKYSAESATAFAQWMVCTYNFNNPIPKDERDPEEVVWGENATISNIDLNDGTIASVRILPVNRGQNIAKLATDRAKVIQTVAFDDDELNDVLNDFFADYLDYTDRDERYSPIGEGREQPDFEREPYPRNGQMQFREEIYWIKNVDQFINFHGHYTLHEAIPADSFRLIPPRDARGRVPGGVDPTASKNDFWAAPMGWLIMQIPGGLTAQDIEIIDECRSRGYSGSEGAENCLGFELFELLNQHVAFDRQTSVVFTLDVTANTFGGAISRRIQSTMNLKNIPAAPASRVGATNQTLQYWHKQIY